MLTLIAAAIVLPQLFAFIVNSFGYDAWRWQLSGLHDPTTLFGAMLWAAHASALALVICYLAQHYEWESYLLGRVGALVFAVIIPMTTFLGAWAVYDVGTYSSYERELQSGQGTFGEFWSFVQGYVINDLAYWIGFILTGVAAVLISSWLRSHLYGDRLTAMAQAATLERPAGSIRAFDQPVRNEDEGQNQQQRVA